VAFGPGAESAVVFDGYLFDRTDLARGLGRPADSTKIDVIVTDENISTDDQRYLTDLGIQVIIA
jgi:hypothetical protein